MFEYLSITFTDIETRVGVHNKNIIVPPYLHLSDWSSSYILRDFLKGNT